MPAQKEVNKGVSRTGPNTLDFRKEKKYKLTKIRMDESSITTAWLMAV